MISFLLANIFVALYGPRDQPLVNQ
jgi:hypothetical protein